MKHSKKKKRVNELDNFVFGCSKKLSIEIKIYNSVKTRKKEIEKFIILILEYNLICLKVIRYIMYISLMILLCNVTCQS